MLIGYIYPVKLHLCSFIHITAFVYHLIILCQFHFFLKKPEDTI